MPMKSYLIHIIQDKNLGSLDIKSDSFLEMYFQHFICQIFHDILRKKFDIKNKDFDTGEICTTD